MSTANGITITQSDKIWNGSPVTVYEGPMQALREYIPIYERRTFGPELMPVSADPGSIQLETPFFISGINHFHDVIVRMPFKTDTVVIPVGIVSKQYALVQHRTLFDEASGAIKSAKVDTADVTARIEMTAFGERMHIGLLLPEQYNLKLNDDVMGLRLECSIPWMAA